MNEFDLQVRSHIYDACLQRGQPPLIRELSNSMDAPAVQIQEALSNLADAHMLVLQKQSGEILMANPFSAVPTPFLVHTPQFSCYGNCIWDSFGIAAMLNQDVHIHTSCADCGSALQVEVINGEFHGDAGIVHFAVPAHYWWDDIVFT